jgi:hypothetical protein
VADADAVAGLDVYFSNGAGGGGGDRGHGFFVFQFEDGLALVDRIAFLDGDAYDDAGFSAFSKFWKLNVHIKCK